MIFKSTVTLFLLIANCPIHHHVEIEIKVPTGAAAFHGEAVSSYQESLVEEYRPILKAVEEGSRVLRRCPKCDTSLYYRVVKAWHMINTVKRGVVVWEVPRRNPMIDLGINAHCLHCEERFCVCRERQYDGSWIDLYPEWLRTWAF